MSGASRVRSAYTGASPAATSSRFWSRAGTSSTVANRSTIALLALARPVSTKLTCRAETPASTARSNWLSRRRRRQARINAPNVAGGSHCPSGVVMEISVPPRRAPDHYLSGNCAAYL